MRRSNEKVYNSGRGITSQALLYQHMSNHYRRILNVKKAVDTAPPSTYKLKHNSVCSSSVRGCSVHSKKFASRNISPTLTERTASTCSNGVSYWGPESCCGRKCQHARHECSYRARLEINQNTDMELINKIAFDTKRAPRKCLDVGWKNGEGRHNSEINSPYEAKKNTHRNNISDTNKKVYSNKSKLATLKRKLSVKEKPPSDLMEKHSKCFISHNNSFCPRILRTNAASKLKSLRVYHPPRKKRGMKRASHWKEEETDKVSAEQIETLKSKCNGVTSINHNSKTAQTCKCKQPVNVRETSQTSSRDSAYNGGVSSLPESRSPTPDQRKQKNCCCHRKESDAYYDNIRTENENIIVPNLKLTDNQDTQTDTNMSERKVVKEENREKSETSISRQKHSNFKEVACSTGKETIEERDYFKRKIKEEALYTNFIRDITSEVLEKGLYTNKALKKVMKRHVLSNLWLLDKDRMLKEIDKLRIQLGIPEDEELKDVKVETVESTLDVDDSYTLISDSELTDPGLHRKRGSKEKSDYFAANSKLPQSSEASCSQTETLKTFPKSISEILHQSDDNNEIVLDTESDDEDEELISVIHVTKLIKDKKKNESYVKDISDQSRNVTQGNSADESEQSSDHTSRKKKSHSRYRKAEQTSSSSDDPEGNSNLDRRRYEGKTDNNRPEKTNNAKSHGSPSKRNSKYVRSESNETDSK